MRLQRAACAAALDGREVGRRLGGRGASGRGDEDEGASAAGWLVLSLVHIALSELNLSARPCR